MSALALLATDAEVEKLAQASDTCNDVALAWHQRQRDPRRSQEIAALLRAGKLEPACQARLDLIACEHRWLEGDPAGALAQIDALVADFDADASAELHCDAQLLLSWVVASLGEHGRRDTALEAAVAAAQAASDRDRATFAEAQQARYLALSDPVQCEKYYADHFEPVEGVVHPGVRGAIFAFRASLAYNTGSMRAAAQWLTQAFELQCATGQIQQSIISANNISETFNQLNDRDAGLEWAQRALDLARPRHWPVALGPCLMRVGETLRKVGHLSLSLELLNEALNVYAPFRQSRNYAQLLIALGETEMALGQAELALGHFEAAARRAEDAGQRDLIGQTAECRAAALLAVDRLDDAASAIAQGLESAEAQGARVRQSVLMKYRARIFSRRGETLSARDALDHALTLARGIPGYLVPPALVEETAAAYAACGDHEAAYRLMCQATEAGNQLTDRLAEGRATAMQLKLETERARAEALQERQRAELLQQTSATLQHLGAIGQEITAELDQERAFEAINRHVHGLLDAQCFSIYLVDRDGRGLTSVFDVEEGQRLAPDHVAMDSPHSHSVRCLRERAELCVDVPSDGTNPSHVPGTLQTVSALFAPLMIGERALGVMTIQSTRRFAFGEHERLIFRTLCAYAAIALDNAVAYTHLRDTQAQLVAQEKMAALGALVAGVAHELNTPIGNCLLVNSSLQESTRELAAAIETNALRRSTLNDYVAHATRASELIGRGLESAAELVQTFKQVAVDRATAQRRVFDLKQTSRDVLAILASSIEKSGHHIELDMPEGLAVDAYPGPYGQVITNFVNNAMIHGFDGGRGGHMRVTARRRKDGWMVVEFCDDGRGIPAADLGRVFDPFFTTRLGQGGSGLGLSISYNIATALFGGTLEARPGPQGGACFTWCLPAVAPASPERDPHAHA